jgi:hypothetical protein
MILNKRAYEDGGASLIAAFKANRARVVVENSEMIGLSFSPNSRPLMPPVFEAAWYDLEGDQMRNWRWSRGDADVVLATAQLKPTLVHVTFRLGSIQPCQMDIYFGNQNVYSGQVTGPEEGAAPIELTLSLPAGPSTLQFRTD